MKRNTIYISHASIIAALYVILTFISSLFGLDKGIIQFRISEALCVLPALTSAAIPGLFAGCLLAGLLCGSVPLDIVFGSLATLLGAILGRTVGRKIKWLTPLPTVAANTLIIPLVLKYAYDLSGAYPYFALTVFIGEFVCGWIAGLILLYSLPKKLTELIKSSSL